MHTNGTAGAAVIIQPLSAEERARLTRYEYAIEQGLEAWWRIKEEGLWREYGTYDSYMEQRWGKSGRRGNQLVAAYKAIVILTEELKGTGVPLPFNENQVRPIAQLAVADPKAAVEIWRHSVEIAGDGGIPGNGDVMQARQELLSEAYVVKSEALMQLRALADYQFLVDEVEGGANPQAALALATAYQSCQDYVRERLLKVKLHDASLVRLINDDYTRKRERTLETLETGYIQYEDVAIKLADAKASDYRDMMNVSYHEHLAEQREKHWGEAVSTLVYNGDPEATLAELLKVLNYSTLIRLGALIGDL